MPSGDIASLIYLVLLGTAVLGWFLAENRQGLGKTARMAMAWVLIFIGFIAAFGLWEDLQSDLIPQQAVIEDGNAIEVPRGPGGHFSLVLELNGVPIQFLVDTGASDVVLTKADAERAGLDPDNLAYLGTARTANGEVKTAFTRVDEVTLGPIIHNDVRVSVTSGDMFGSLLGMSYLQRFDRIEISGDRLTLYP